MHVEAGLRTGGHNLTPFPEELNRQLISCIACLHFAPTTTNQENLVREDVPVGQIFVPATPAIDALRWASGADGEFDDPSCSACTTATADRLVTAHRRESWGNGLGGIAEGVARLARAHPDVRFVVPDAPEPAGAREPAAPARPRERAADRSVRLRASSHACWTLPAGDHRLRRHPGGGAVARQAGARHAREHRAQRGHPGWNAAARRHRPRPHRDRRETAC